MAGVLLGRNHGRRQQRPRYRNRADNVVGHIDALEVKGLTWLPLAAGRDGILFIGGGV